MSERSDGRIFTTRLGILLNIKLCWHEVSASGRKNFMSLRHDFLARQRLCGISQANPISEWQSEESWANMLSSKEEHGIAVLFMQLHLISKVCMQFWMHLVIKNSKFGSEMKVVLPSPDMNRPHEDRLDCHCGEVVLGNHLPSSSLRMHFMATVVTIRI